MIITIDTNAMKTVVSIGSYSAVKPKINGAGLFQTVRQGLCDSQEFGLDKTQKVSCTLNPKPHSKAM